MNNARSALAAAVLLCVLAACGGGGSTATAKVVLSTQDLIVDTSPYSSLPLALGYWEDEGLDVTIDSVNGVAAAVQLVVGGEGDALVGGVSSGLFVPRSQGADLVAYYSHVPANIQNPAVPEDSPIASIADLKGTQIGVASLNSSSVEIIKALATGAGLNADADIEFVPVGVGAQAAAALFVSRDIDALALWDGQYASIERSDPSFQLRVVSSELGEQLRFSNALMARGEDIEANPDVLVGIARGIAKATVFASANPEAAVRLHWETYPEVKPQDISEEEALEEALVILNARLEDMDITQMEGRDDGRWGYMEPEAVELYYREFMQPAVGDIDLDTVFSNALVDEISDFDAEQIRTEAESWEP